MSDGHPLAERLTGLIVQLIRAALPTDEAARAVPRAEAVRLHAEIRALLGTEDLVGINLDGFWTRACEDAFEAVSSADDPDSVPLQASPQLPASPPLSLGDLVGPNLALAELEETIRLSAATG